MTTRKDCLYILESTGPIKIACCNQAAKFAISYRCSIHKRCVDAPMVKKEKILNKWKEMKPESDIYTLCQTCCEYSSKRTLPVSHNENSEK